MLVPHPEGNRVIGRRWRQDNQEQTLEPLKNDLNWGMPLLSVKVCTAIPFMEQATDEVRDYMDELTKKGPPRVAGDVMHNHKDMSQEEQIDKLLDMHELKNERVVSKLMLDMVCLVEAIHFERDGSMHARNVDGEHDGTPDHPMTPDV